MSIRVEGLGAVASATSSAIAAVLDWPILFLVAVLLAVGVTVSHFSQNKIQDIRAPRPPQPPAAPTTPNRAEKAISA